MAQRKLLQEIDKVIKKVKEGTQEFDYLYEKLTTCENSSQKEKLEGDLKKEIKKLQRSRDQIKTWMSGNEVKDKSQLTEMRKEIEADMEKFKDIEKEMKTKAFSKQGLNMQLKLDPREKEKLETANFIQNMIEELVLQSESLELRIDSLSSSKRKLTSKKQEEVKDNQEKLERNNYHQTQLETILRLLENGDLDTDDIAEIKEDIEYYVDHNQEDLFVDDDSIYDALGLESKEEYFNNLEEKEDSLSSVPPGVSSPALPPATSGNQSPVPPSPPALPLSSAASTTQQLPSMSVKRIVSNPAPIPTKPTMLSTNSSSSLNTIPTATKVTATPKVKYASIIAANQQQQQQQAAAAAAAAAASTTTTAANTPVQIPAMATQPLSAIPISLQQGPPGLTRITTNTTTASSVTRESTRSPQLISHNDTNNLEECESIKDLLPSLKEAQKLIEQPLEFEEISEILKASLLTCPDSFDSDKRKIYHSESPTRTFVYYPQEPLILLTNNTKNLAVYDESTLFYIFYHHRLPLVNISYHTTYGKYLQFSAAKELVRRGWWFHTRDQIWVRKDDEDDWKYFDDKNDWAMKKMDNDSDFIQYLAQL